VSAGLSCCGSLPSGLHISSCHSPTTWCDGITSGKCLAVHASGSCLSSAECGNPNNDVYTAEASYACINGECVNERGLPPNAPCQVDSDCGADICTGGVCGGSAAGGSCLSILECPQGYFCDSGTCNAQLALGADCSSVAIQDQFTACLYGSICDNNICTALFSKTLGQSCVTSSECGFNLFCFDDGTGATCVAPPPPKTCSNNNNTECETGLYAGECACNPFVNAVQCEPLFTAAPTSCESAGQTLYSCITSNKCDRSVGVTCCQNELACYEDCVINGLGAANLVCANLPKCTASTTHSAAVSVQASFLFVVLALIAILAL